MNNPELTSWVSVPADSDFPIQNLPFGIFSTADRSARPGVAIGEQILDLSEVAAMGLLDDLGCEREDFEASTLNAFIGRGKQATRAVRNRLGELLQVGAPELADHASRVLMAQSDATMHLPECGVWSGWMRGENKNNEDYTLFHGRRKVLRNHIQDLQSRCT
ncbi:hypothetical protein OAG54_01330 [Flavobacteriales bacterium]|nr:hypothetical protein [Flavobacteriales bacterium]